MRKMKLFHLSSLFSVHFYYSLQSASVDRLPYLEEITSVFVNSRAVYIYLAELSQYVENTGILNKPCNLACNPTFKQYITV